MNRILYDAEEVEGDRLTLRDVRAEHIRRVLRSAPGDELALGEINGPRVRGRVERVDGGGVELSLVPGELPSRPSTDLLLALPRPKVLRRLLPQIAALGVGRLFLVNASRVERYYFDTHVLDAAHLRAGLLEGLSQAGDTLLPEVRVVKRLKVFMEDEMAGDREAAGRVMLDPRGEAHLLELPEVLGRSLLAVGPEGGWRDYEREMFAGCGFASARLTERVLRTDTACVAALAAMTMLKR